MSIDISDKNIRNREKDFLPPAFSKNGPERAGSHPVELFSRTGRTCYGFQIFIRSKEEEEEEEEEGKKEEPAIVEEPVVETVVKEEEPKSAVLGESLKLSAGLRHAISLNDSFRFSRELFGGNTDLMNRVIEQISVMSSYKTAVAFLSSKVELNEEKEAVNDFLELLKKYFNQSV